MSRFDSRACLLFALTALLSATGCAAGTRSEIPVFGAAGPTTMAQRGMRPAKSFVYVANYFGTRGVDVYPADISGPRVLRSIRAGVAEPDAVWVDLSGTLYVANAGANDVTIYRPGGSRPKLVLRDGLHFPDAVTTDAGGNVWVANANRADVVEYAPGGIHPVATLTDGVVLADGLAFDTAGNLYVANYTSNRKTGSAGNVEVYPPGASSPSSTISNGLTAPTGLAFDASQTLYVADYRSNGAVVEYPHGATSPSLTITTGVEFPTSVAVDQAGLLYVGSAYYALVSEYALGGTYPIGTIQGAGLNPSGLAASPPQNR